MTDREASTRRRSAPVHELVEAARTGKQWAKEALFRRHVVMANRSARRLVDRDDQDDLVQDSFEQAFAALDKLRDPESFGVWLHGILIRQAGKMHRKHRLLSRLGLRDQDSFNLEQAASPHTPPEVRVELRELSQALRMMPADVRIAVVLRRVEGRKLQEIADLTQVSRTTVKRRLERGARMLDRIDKQGRGS